MCGNVGIAGDLATKDENCIKRLLLLDSSRGLDSTGLAVITNSGDAKIAKVPSHPFDLFDMMKFRSILNGNTSRVFLGHNRAMTRGIVNHANAHPFDCGHIVGAHNGTLEWSVHKDLEKKIGMQFSSDSLALFAAISEFGIEEVVPILKGAWSIVYVNLKDGTLNFLRNKERPMWLAYSKDFKRLFWASEWPMISAAIHLGSYGEELYVNERKNSFFVTEENVHYSFSLDELKKGGKSRPKPKAKKLEGAPETPFAHSGNCSAVHKGGPDPFKRDYSSKKNSTTQSKTSFNKEDNGPPVLVHIPTEKEPYCKLITEAEFNACLLNNSVGEGCSFCGEPIKWGDQGITIYVRDKKMLCPKHSPRTNGESRTRIYIPNTQAA